MSDEENGGWQKYQKLVISKLEDHHEKLNTIDERISGISIEVAQLKAQARIWGAGTGLVMSTVVSAIAQLIAN